MNRRLAKLEGAAGPFGSQQSILDEVDAADGERDGTTSSRATKELETVASGIEKEIADGFQANVIGGFEGDDYPGALPGSGNATANRLAAVAKHGKIGAKYRDLFGGELSRDGWSSPQEYFAAIHSGMTHPRLSAITEGTGSGGGWLVPTEYAAEMLDAAMEDSIVLPRARIYPMQSDTKKIAGFDSSTNTSSSVFGGIEAQWIGESATGSPTNPKVRKIELKAKKLALFTSSSNEVAEDGMGLEGQLDEAMRQGNGWFLDYAFLRGTGVGQPLGVLNVPRITVDKNRAGSRHVIYESLIKMFAVSRELRQQVGLGLQLAAIPQLLTLYAPTALTGQFVPVLREANGGWQLLTRPVLFTEKLPTVGDKGDVLLADFSQYAIGVRKEMTIEKSGHVYFMSDETAWRAITRVDGQGRWNKAFTPANGTTQSWCVTLAARA